MRKFICVFMGIVFLSGIARADEGPADNSLRLIADVHALPYFMEPTYAMNGMAFNGSVFFGWGSRAIFIGAEVWENYLTLDAPTDVYNYNGAWNILRGTATLHLAPADWLALKFGLGGAWFSSAFSSDDVGIVGRQGPAASAVADAAVILVPAVLSIALRNRLDLVFLPEGLTPFYYGGLNISVSPGVAWLTFYAEAGVQTFIQADLPRTQNDAMFVWGAGVRINIAFAAASAGAAPVTVTVTVKKPIEGKKPVRDEQKEREKQVQELKTGTTGKIVAFDTIIFFPDSPAIKPESYPVLDQIALILKERKTIAVEIRGHTNDLGDAKDEFDLSLKRAEAVRKYLVGKGIALARMKCAGLGSEFSKNLAVTETNRKVEFRILSE
jgi:outer membrane protein OmpA-like peptidoglycan-associated protein